MTQTVDHAIAAFAPRLPLLVALSGGADSTALLLACSQRWPDAVMAVHVNHGLQSVAADFERHCVALCARLRVPLQVQRVDARHASGQSPEDAARTARYASISAAQRTSAGFSAIKDVALGQHADDQVETLLLALSRGAGLPGLASMPRRWERDGLVWHRPLLKVRAADIRAWLTARGERWVEDPTNADERFTRNRIRARLLPALQEAFPSFRETFARSAAHAAQAKDLLEQLAALDLDSVGAPPRIAELRALPRERQANALRHWLRTGHRCAPSAAQLEELLDQVADGATRGHAMRIKVAGGMVRRDGEVLAFDDAA